MFTPFLYRWVFQSGHDLLCRLDFHPLNLDKVRFSFIFLKEETWVPMMIILSDLHYVAVEVNQTIRHA
jgi:hypothetical protein